MSTTKRAPAKQAAKKPATRPRKMGGMPATLTGKRKPRKKMTGSKPMDIVKDVMLTGLGILGGAMMPTVVKKVAPAVNINPHLINAGSAGVGVFLAWKVKGARGFGVGMAAGAAVNSALIAVPQLRGMTGGHTSRVRSLSQQERAKLIESVREATGDMRGMMPDTLTGYDVAR